MRNWIKHSSGISVLALSLMLAACGGGGGVDSTPTPTPTPAPTPTPTPTPTPAPGPSYSSFDSLKGNQTAKVATVSLKLNNIGGLSPDSTRTLADGLTAQFNLDAGTIILTVPDGTKATFDSNDIDQAASFPGKITYTKYGGDGARYQDQLILTSQSVNGRELDYVRTGAWYHFSYNDTGVFTGVTGEGGAFGIPTVASDVPVSGSASYNAVLTGDAVVAGSNSTISVYTLSRSASSATFEANFATGAITTNLDLKGWDYWKYPTGPGSSDLVSLGQLNGSGALSSSKPSFSGTFANTTKSAFSGAFFGPQASEFGYYYSVETPTLSSYGSVAGLKANGALGFNNTSLASLTTDVRGFAAHSIFRNYLKDASGNFVSPEDDDDAPDDNRLILSYNAQNNSYTLQHAPSSVLAENIAALGSFGSAQLAATQPDPHFNTYAKSVAGGTLQLQLYKLGSQNGEIALTYTSIGHLTFSRSATGSSTQQVFEDWFTYGLPLSGGASVQVPTSGTGTYNGVIYGTAVPTEPNGVPTAGKFYDVKGTSQFIFDFAASKFNAMLNPILVSRSGAANEALAQFAFNNGYMVRSPTFGENANQFNSDFSSNFPTTPGGPTGALSGSLYGPNATEFGAIFYLNTGASFGNVHIVGATAGKKAP